MVSNNCPLYTVEFPTSPTCGSYTFPNAAYIGVQSGTAKAAPLRNALAYSLKGGVFVFGEG